MAVATSAGSKIAISIPLPATQDDTGYEALTFEDIGEVESIDEYGITYNPVTFTALADRRTRKFKGSYDPGDPTVSIAIDRDDAGQDDCRTALNQDENVAFSVTYQDGTIDYFEAKVLSFTTNVGSVEDITMASMQIGINSDLVTVAP